LYLYVITLRDGKH